MRFATYSHNGAKAAGVIVADAIHPLGDGVTLDAIIGEGLKSARARGEKAMRGQALPLGSVQLRCPVTPASIRDFVTFEEHVQGVRRSVDNAIGVPESWYDAPTFYFTNPHTVIGPEDVVPFPAHCRARDFELEVAVVVGAGGSSLTSEQAREHVFGYTLLNDWSARDIQGREMQVGLGPAKGKDFATTLGPCIVTADELEDRRDADGFLDLDCAVTVNGTQIGRDRLSHMGWTFETMIAYASRDSRVMPGDVLGSGTVGGGGCLAELWGRNGGQTPPPLRVGDVVEIAVDGIGRLSNVIGQAGAAPELPPVRRSARASNSENN